MAGFPGSRLALGSRSLAGGQCLGGALLVARPRAVTRTVGGSSPPALVVQLLGARMLAQGLIQALRPSRGVLLGGCGVDAVHALSMVAAALRYPAYRRSALASGGTATVAAALGATLALAGSAR
jgi:hypothetical protein